MLHHSTWCGFLITSIGICTVGSVCCGKVEAHSLRIEAWHKLSTWTSSGTSNLSWPIALSVKKA